MTNCPVGCRLCILASTFLSTELHVICNLSFFCLPLSLFACPLPFLKEKNKPNFILCMLSVFLCWHPLFVFKGRVRVGCTRTSLFRHIHNSYHPHQRGCFCFQLLIRVCSARTCSDFGFSVNLRSGRVFVFNAADAAVNDFELPCVFPFFYFFCKRHDILIKSGRKRIF